MVGASNQGLAYALEILRDDCGVLLPKWIPYNTMLVPMAAILASAKPEGAEAGAQREKVQRWFWCSVFAQWYENATNSRAARDLLEVRQWLSGGEEPYVVKNLSFNPATLREVTQRQRGIYRGLISLVVRNGARDFHTQSVISSRLMLEEGIDDHHVFPADFLEKTYGKQCPKELRDCVLNRTLIDRATNGTISNRAPSDYMQQIRAVPGFSFEAVLNSHALPGGEDSPFWTDDFEAYLASRGQRLMKLIVQATGCKPQTAEAAA
jgi:hypothetical protein